MQRIDSIDDPRVASYRNLRDRTLRGESLFVTEGRLLALRLLESRYRVESLLVGEHFSEEFAQIAAGRVPLYVAPTGLLQQIAGFRFHRGVLAAGRRDEPKSLQQLLSGKTAADAIRLAVCPAPIQPDNMGLIFRAAAGFGIDGLLLGSQSCDPFARRCLRLSMGGVLSVPFARSEDVAADLDALENRWNVTRVGAVLDPRAEPLGDFAWPRRAALLLGNELEGLDARTLAACDHRVTIPMHPDTDSLNVGVAAGIFVYEMMKGLPQDGRPATAGR